MKNAATTGVKTLIWANKLMMDVRNIDFQTLLFSQPSPETKIYIPFTILFSLFVVIAFLMRFVKGSNQKVAMRYFWPLMTSGILGLLYLFARHEGLSYLGDGIVIAFVFVLFFVAVIWNTIWAARYIPRQKMVEKADSRYKKYLPKAKKK